MTDTGNRLLAAALRYAARGLAVLPCWWPLDAERCACGKPGCPDNGKHPLGALVEHGLTDATTDPETIRGWWARYPRANVAVRGGEIAMGEFLSVLDVDPRNGGDDSLFDLVREHGNLPDTPEVLTGGGGRHFYLVGPVPLASRNSKLGPGLDVKAGGGPRGRGYVLAPPSMHTSGREYAWEASSPSTFAPPPGWLVDLANREAFTDASGRMEIPATIGEGERNVLLHKVASSLRGRGVADGFTEAEILPLVLAVNAGRCVPALDEREVRTIVRSACAKPRGPSEAYTARMKARADDRERWARIASEAPDEPLDVAAFHELARAVLDLCPVSAQADATAWLRARGLLDLVGDVWGCLPADEDTLRAVRDKVAEQFGPAAWMRSGLAARGPKGRPGWWTWDGFRLLVPWRVPGSAATIHTLQRWPLRAALPGEPAAGYVFPRRRRPVWPWGLDDAGPGPVVLTSSPLEAAACRAEYARAEQSAAVLGLALGDDRGEVWPASWARIVAGREVLVSLGSALDGGEVERAIAQAATTAGAASVQRKVVPTGTWLEQWAQRVTA